MLLKPLGIWVGGKSHINHDMVMDPMTGNIYIKSVSGWSTTLAHGRNKLKISRLQKPTWAPPERIIPMTYDEYSPGHFRVLHPHLQMKQGTTTDNIRKKPIT